MEALLFMFDVACMTYLCWRIYKFDAKRSASNDLGFFRYDGSEAPVSPDAAKGRSQGTAQDRSRGRAGA